MRDYSLDEQCFVAESFRRLVIISTLRKLTSDYFRTTSSSIFVRIRPKFTFNSRSDFLYYRLNNLHLSKDCKHRYPKRYSPVKSCHAGSPSLIARRGDSPEQHQEKQSAGGERGEKKVSARARACGPAPGIIACARVCDVNAAAGETVTK